MLEGSIALFGGSFNPPHIGHQMACLYLLEALGADEVWLIPTHSHAFGKNLAPFAHRLAMCERLTAPFAKRLKVLDIESRIDAGGRTYVVLRQLHKEFPNGRFALVMGADLLPDTPKWYRWQDLHNLVQLVVLGRDGYAPAPESLRQGDVLCPLGLPAVSSTQIRQMLRQKGDISGYVPQQIKRYIEQHHLYSGE